jgi:hypothetical protein
MAEIDPLRFVLDVLLPRRWRRQRPASAST